jgi:hypothetical protein
MRPESDGGDPVVVMYPGRCLRAGTLAGMWHLLLWIVAVVLVVLGVVRLLQGAVILGIVLIVLGLLVGPGGVSLLS